MSKTRHLRLAHCLLLTVLTLSACGGGANQPTATPTDVPPTLTPFPTFAFVEPTKPPVFDKTSENTPAADRDESPIITLDPKNVERGRGRYEALECGICHGNSGEGSASGKSLLDFAMSEEDFITFMRSGGDLGTSHQFSTDRLSNSGSRNLFQYLVSISQGS